MIARALRSSIPPSSITKSTPIIRESLVASTALSSFSSIPRISLPPSSSGLPIASAEVSIEGTRTKAALNPDGTFSIVAALTDVTVVVRSIGYKSAEIPVPAGPSAPNLTVALQRDIFQLEEVVVTGQATVIQRRNLANAVASISADAVEEVPAQSVEHTLQGKIAGADIQANSGAPGGGVQVRLRGITSIIGASEPLYVVDGVIVSNVAIPSNQNAVTNAAGGSNPSLDQDAQVNRIADLNPNDIENIEVLKGASASAIYGSKASNGVIVVTTKRGRLGAPRFELMQRGGFYQLSRKIGSRSFETLAEATDAFGAAAANYYQQGRAFDHEALLSHRKDPSFETALNIGGETVVAVIADDPAAATDIPAWCRMRGHDYVGVDDDIDGAPAYLVRRVG